VSNPFPSSGEGKETPTQAVPFSKRYNGVDVALPTPEDGNGSSFRNVVFPSYVKLVHQPRDSEISSTFNAQIGTR
jgi:hypothetical protein